MPEILAWLLNQGAAIAFLAIALWWMDKRYRTLEGKHDKLQEKYEAVLPKLGEQNAVQNLINHLVASETRIIEAVLKTSKTQSKLD